VPRTNFAEKQGIGFIRFRLLDGRRLARMMSRDQRLFPWFLVALGFLLWPRVSWAIQTHGDPEGLYAHQLGHVFFLIAMVYVCWQIWRQGLTSKPGFPRLFWACILFGAWNILTFIGHIAEERLDPGAIDRQAGYFWRTLHITDLNGLLFYLAKLDHLLLVPAFLMFYLALRAFRRQQLKVSGS